ncbi:MAG: Nif3-like dinuclear metal center hexameric protein [Firmicutes bacterium]|nr:Nif3-like dinuclear metal center hexameric protein [Bacillota bacterium]HOB35256.1 Nif3-like dinuclear metal center hexameric protein [Bacillota bacterium]HPZ89790.1 Nif3-like dinuclear metal center hexameric protein [Bacillota bacterium]HQE01194.1 Nif3-like dinuclear metal center hexameric protein [Bacillota bacterium]
MAVTTGQIISVLETLAPVEIQADWDNSGLQAGSRQQPVEKILLTLDVTAEVLQYAADNGYGLVVAHHPFLFHKLSRVDLETPAGRILELALANKISIYAMHTNLDMVQGGVSDVLAQLLGLEDVEVLDPQKGHYFKLAVFVPLTHLDQVRQALGDAGAGWIGNYSHCTFAAPGTGTFLPREGANPWMGEPGKLEQVEEARLETLVPSYRLEAVLAAMRSAHPYEEIAYDLFPLAMDASFGLGRLGVLPQTMNLGALAQKVARVLHCAQLRICGDVDKPVRRVALCGGSGGRYVDLARRRGADVLITGDIDHHQALDAQQTGLALIDPGHYASEYPVLYKAEAHLRSNLPGEIVITRYPGSTNPMRWQSCTFCEGEGD